MWAREVQAALAGDVGERGVGLGPAGQDSGRGDGDVGQRGRGEWPGSCSSFRSVAVPVRAGRRFSRVCVCVRVPVGTAHTERTAASLPALSALKP